MKKCISVFAIIVLCCGCAQILSAVGLIDPDRPQSPNANVPTVSIVFYNADGSPNSSNGFLPDDQIMGKFVLNDPKDAVKLDDQNSAVIELEFSSGRIRRQIVIETQGSADGVREYKFRVLPDEISVDDENHLQLAQLLEPLEHGQYEIKVILPGQKPAPTGSFILDLSRGKGGFEVAIKEIKARRQKIIDDYANAGDFVNVTLVNNSSKTIELFQKTNNSLTDKPLTVGPKSNLKIKARPNEKIMRGQTTLATIRQSTKIDVTPEPLLIESIQTVYSGDDAWKSWTIATNRGQWKLSTRYGGDDAWKSWNLSTDNDTWEISTVYSGDDAWKKWRLRADGKVWEISTVYSGDDAWKSWRVTGNGSPMEIGTVYSGDDAWKSWKIKGNGGSMSVSTRYGGDDAWKSWNVQDSLKDADEGEKIAAMFACLVPAFIKNSSSPKAACAFKGKQLYGSVKIVEYGEDIKVKYVDYSQDIKVQFVENGADSCGEWKIVEYGENFKIKIVEYGEDLKVKKVDYGPGI